MDYKVSVTPTGDYKVSLSRTGSQGSKGDSVTNAAINTDGNLIITITRSDGTTYEIDAGNLESNINLADLPDFQITTPKSEGDILIYDADEEVFKNHSLTTTRLLDVDNTNKTDGALLVFDGTSQKYVATNRIEKQTTTVTGGNY